MLLKSLQGFNKKGCALALAISLHRLFSFLRIGHKLLLVSFNRRFEAALIPSPFAAVKIEDFKVKLLVKIEDFKSKLMARAKAQQIFLVLFEKSSMLLKSLQDFNKQGCASSMRSSAAHRTLAC